MLHAVCSWIVSCDGSGPVRGESMQLLNIKTAACVLFHGVSVCGVKAYSNMETQQNLGDLPLTWSVVVIQTWWGEL